MWYRNIKKFIIMRTINLESVLELLPSVVSLIYIDYNDDLLDNPEGMQAIIWKDDSIYEKVDEWFYELAYYGEREYLKELEEDLRLKFDIEEEEARTIIEEYEEELLEELRSRDNSNPLQDLISNTGDVIMFYDTGLYLDEPDTDAQIRLNRIIIKKFFGILDTDRWDDEIDTVVRESYYGGSLHIYFKESLDFFNNDVKSIKFSDFYFGIINTDNGSGFHGRLDGLSVILPFDRKRLFIEENTSYNYTYDIAGMMSDWCEGTTVALLTEVTEKTLLPSITGRKQELERQYEDTFRKGGCTFGDMNYKRHRDVYYRNDYPAGNKCPHCGTFWVD